MRQTCICVQIKQVTKLLIEVTRHRENAIKMSTKHLDAKMKLVKVVVTVNQLLFFNKMKYIERFKTTKKLCFSNKKKLLMES